MRVFSGRFVLHCVAALLAMIGLAGCSHATRKNDPGHHYKTDTGFTFQFPMAGEWFHGKPVKGQYLIGKEPTSDGSTSIVVVRHAPIWTPGGKPMTANELLDGFQKQIEADSKAGRARQIKSTFSRRKQAGADCMFYQQMGQDLGPRGAMDLATEGMICLHPSHNNKFIWMAMSQRVPVGKKREDLSTDKAKLFSSLRFL